MLKKRWFGPVGRPLQWSNRRAEVFSNRLLNFGRDYRCLTILWCHTGWVVRCTYAPTKGGKRVGWVQSKARQGRRRRFFTILLNHQKQCRARERILRRGEREKFIDIKSRIALGTWQHHLALQLITLALSPLPPLSNKETCWSHNWRGMHCADAVFARNVKKMWREIAQLLAQIDLLEEKKWNRNQLQPFIRALIWYWYVFDNQK